MTLCRIGQIATCEPALSLVRHKTTNTSVTRPPGSKSQQYGTSRQCRRTPRARPRCAKHVLASPRGWRREKRRFSWFVAGHPAFVSCTRLVAGLAPRTLGLVLYSRFLSDCNTDAVRFKRKYCTALVEVQTMFSVALRWSHTTRFWSICWVWNSQTVRLWSWSSSMSPAPTACSPPAPSHKYLQWEAARMAGWAAIQFGPRAGRLIMMLRASKKAPRCQCGMLP